MDAEHEAVSEKSALGASAKSRPGSRYRSDHHHSHNTDTYKIIADKICVLKAKKTRQWPEISILFLLHLTLLISYIGLLPTAVMTVSWSYLYV